jgi:2-dehydropantoate 2-reductase
MTISVVGAGGIGCAVGYALCTAGVSVSFVDVHAGKIDWGNRHGVQLDQRPPLPARFLPFDDWVPESGDTVLLCTKCYDNARVLSRLPPSVTLIPIQNGFDPLLEARGHALEGIASFVSECAPHRPHTRITRAGRLHVGVRHPTPEPPALDWLRSLRAMASFTVRLVADILPYKYTKLMYNAAIGPLASVAGLDNGQLLSVPQARRLFFDMLKENYAILHGAGIRLGKIGPFHPRTVSRILDLAPVANALAWAFYPTLRGSYCSMAGDLPRGRTEVDYYNGRLIELAGAGPCPINRSIYQLVKRMERDPLVPGLDRLEELLAARAFVQVPG